MASLVFSAAGSALGGALGGSFGAVVGRMAGALGGAIIDRSLFASSPGSSSINRSVEGPRLKDLDVISSSEGAPIPRVLGRARLSGQLIWATRFQEEVVVTSSTSETRTTNRGGKGGGGGGGSSTSSVTTTTTSYVYYGNFAVALCEGPIASIGRVWADGKPLALDTLNMRLHNGDESQSPDPLIVAKQGAANAPAYRGTAYCVFERLPLEPFGNRIPQLSFEIIRPLASWNVPSALLSSSPVQRNLATTRAFSCAMAVRGGPCRKRGTVFPPIPISWCPWTNYRPSVPSWSACRLSWRGSGMI